MISDKHNEYEITHNLEGRKIAFTMEVTAASHLMDVLTKMYPNPQLATLRELASNALDSHVEAKQSRPIEVTLPTDWKPVLTVKDFGVGMSEDDIEKIYTRYGASTKRETNEQTGMLGLGSKAPLAYCDQFTVISIKDGMKIEASVAKNAEGAAELTIAKSIPTDKDNGVTVIVPTDSDNNFKELATDLFKYWEEGTVLINKEQPERIQGLKLGGKKFMLVDADSGDSNRHRLVMGGVPYPMFLPDLKISEKKALIYFAPMGSVHFTPARDGLMDTPKTRETLEKLNGNYRSIIIRQVKNKLKKAKSRRHALEILIEYRQFLKENEIQALKYGKSKMPVKLEFKELTDDAYPDPHPIRTVTPIAYWERQGNTGEPFALQPHEWVNYIWVTNFKPAKFSKVYREKLYLYAQKKNLHGLMKVDTATDTKFVLLTGNLPSRVKTWVGKDYIVSWEDVKKATKPERGTAVSGANDHYEQWNETTENWNGAEIHADDLIEFDHVFYLDAPRTSNYKTTYKDGGRHPDKAKLLTRCYPGAKVVRTAKNRQSKLCRLVPQALHARDVWQETYDKWLADLTDQEKMALYYRLPYVYGGGGGDLTAINETLVRDPIAKGVIKEYKFIKGFKKPRITEERDMWSMIGFKEDSNEWEGMEKLSVNYPLITSGSIDKENVQDAILYMNTKYSTSIKRRVKPKSKTVSAYR